MELTCKDNEHPNVCNCTKTKTAYCIGDGITKKNFKNIGRKGIPAISSLANVVMRLEHFSKYLEGSRRAHVPQIEEESKIPAELQTDQCAAN